MAKKDKNAKLAETEAAKGRMGVVEQLQKERFEKIRRMEEICADYAKLTGDKSYANRKDKVGKAANDYKG